MIPLKDENPTERFPFVTIAIIAINVVFFALQIMYDNDAGSFTGQLAVLPFRFTIDPSEFFRINQFKVYRFSPYLTLISYNFLHGGLLHLVFNMLYLWVFGNNIEDALGHFKFILFYLACGIAAGLLHIGMNMDSTVQMVGASGAIAGILGAYIVLYPYSNIHSLFFFLIFIRVIKIPALFFIGFWFFIQIMNVAGGAKGNIAWYAHIGGFIAGIALIMLFNPKKKRKKLHIVYH